MKNVNNMVRYMNRNNRPRRRDDIAEGFTIKGKCSCGNIYVTVNEDEEGAVETFIRLGKSGGCATSSLEAIGRLISISLQYNVPLNEVVEQLEFIRCPVSQWDNGIQIVSCSDAIAKILKKYRDNIVYSGEDDEQNEKGEV